MKITFLYKGRYPIRQAFDLETLSAVIRSREHDLSLVYDPDTFGITDNVLQIPRLAHRLDNPKTRVLDIVASDPDVVVVSALPATYTWCAGVAKSLKALRNVPVVFLGLHASLAASRVIREPFVDYVIEGEAEGAIGPLLDALRTGEGFDSVGNLWSTKDGTPRFTHRADLVDLDTLPLPDKGLFFPHVSHTFSYMAMVSRGCFFNCSYCEETCNRKLYGPRYFRRKKVDTVMRELTEAKRKYRFREVIFKDSYLSGDRTWLRELMERYHREIAVPFKCFCTVSGFDESTAQRLKESGCYCIEFGLQTWNDRIRREVLRREETRQQALQVFELCAKHKLWYDVDHMLGLPGETVQDHREAALCYHKLRYLNRVKVHYLVYHPGAEILDLALDKGDLSHAMLERNEQGGGSDFYDTAYLKDPVTTGAYATLLKLIPAMPGFLLHRLLKGTRIRFLRLIPQPLLILFQGLIALRSRDLRFAVYIRHYPAKVFRTLFRPKSHSGHET